MFIRIQDKIFAKSAIEAITLETTTVGRGRPEDERAWYINVECKETHHRIEYPSRDARSKALDEIWAELQKGA